MTWLSLDLPPFGSEPSGRASGRGLRVEDGTVSLPFDPPQGREGLERSNRRMDRRFDLEVSTVRLDRTAHLER